MADRLVHASEPEGGVVVVRMDDPSTDNGLTARLCDELEAALAAAAADERARAVLLCGRGDVFSSGATLGELRRVADGRLVVRDVELPRRILELPLPVVAAVEGHAIGGGLVLAACCDVTIGALERRYGANFTDLGFTPGMGATALFPELVGPAFANEMLMTAKLYRGSELVGRGLFTHLVPGEEVLERARDVAARLADKPRHVLVLLKETLARPRALALASASEREHAMHEACFSHPETIARIDDRFGGRR